MKYALKNRRKNPQSFPGGRKGSTGVATIFNVAGRGGGGGCVCGGVGVWAKRAEGRNTVFSHGSDF